MFNKNQSTWERNINYEEATVFKTLLDKLKTYSKCFNSSTYSVTSTLMDVYKNIKFQHALWVELTNFAPDTLTLFGLTIQKGMFYNLLKHVDTATILNSTEFRNYLELGWIKAADAKLFEDIINPTRKDWFCFYEPRKVNQYINQPFDYLVVRYILKDPSSLDIDTRTAIVNSGYQGLYKEDGVTKNSLVLSLDGNDIGWNRRTELSSTAGNTYLMWGGDNTTSVGGESILIDFKRISTDLSYLENVQIRLRAFFYDTIASGKIELELSTYKGGTMSNVGTDFINTGGFLVQSIKTERTIVTQNASDIDGDDLGTIIFNTENSNAILTDVLNTTIQSNNLSFSDLLNSIDFNKFDWQMGTSGYLPNDVNYTDMLISSNFTEESLKDSFQDSYNEWGYTERNLFTSEKVWKKLLNHFHIIDIATTEHIDIFDINKNSLPYPIIDIDGIRIVNGHKVLFKNQKDTYQNGVYVYTNSVFVKSDIFNTDEDLNYFSCFIKEGSINKNKEFFLESKEDGTYPSFDSDTCGCKCNCSDITTICPQFVFIEGNNYVLRNRSSYKLLADHIFTDSDYFVQYEPITSFDYTDRYFDNGTSFNISGTAFFTVNKEFNKLEYYLNNNLYFTNNAGTNAFDKLNTRIEVLNNKLFLLRNQKELVKFNNFTNIPNKDIFSNIITFNKNYSDFQLLNSTQGYFLQENGGSTQGFSLVDKITFINNTSLINNTLKLNENAKEIRVLNNSYVFYTTFNGVYLYWNNKNYKIRDNAYPTKLRVLQNGNNIKLSYLINETPEILEISETELNQMLSWVKNDDYEVVKFSKYKISSWEIASTAGINNLYLKGTQITNLNGTNYFINVPKIQDTNSRYFDGADDYDDLNLAYNFNNNQTYFNQNISLSTLQNTQITQGSFTLEFKINPDEIRVNQTPIYFGNKSTTYVLRFGGFRYRIPLKPNDFISFTLDSGDGFPVFLIKKGSKLLSVKSNQKLIIGQESHVSFVWNYTANKAYGELYFDGVLVGSYIDQKTGTNLPIDVRTIVFEKSFFGKSEIVTSPYFKGYMREVRLWNKALNNSQIFTRLDKDIDKDNENFINNLIGYWKLNDDKSINYNLAQGNNFYKSTKDKLSAIGAAIFVGGLNNDILLKEIQNPQLIQLSDNFLYLLDSKSYETYENSLNNISSTGIFYNQGTSGVQILTDPTLLTNTSSIFVDLNTKSLNSNITKSNRWGILQTIQPNDILEIEVETYYSNSNSTGGALSVIYGTSALMSNGTSTNIVIFNNNVSTWSTSANTWNTLKLKYTVGSTILGLGFELQVDQNPAYFRNLKYKITRANEVYNIYKFDLFKEKISRIRSSYDIDSIYLEINNSTNNNKLYTLENNKIYSYNTNFSVLPINTFTNSTAVDFAVINNKYFYLDNSNNIWEGTSGMVYNESTAFNIETIYGFDDSRINKTVLYSKNDNQDIDFLSRNISSINSNFNYIATHPLPKNNSASFNIVNGSNSTIKTLEIINNNVYFNNSIVDLTNKNWNFNNKNILGIFKKNDNYGFVISKTILNEIKLWLFNTYTNEITKIANYKNDTTLFITENTSVNLQYYTIDNGLYNDEWIIVNDNTDLYFYQLEKTNKINYKKLVQELSIDTNKDLNNIYNYSNTDIWLSLFSGETEFLSTYTNSTSSYNLWNDTLEFNKIETGWLIGESGILFKDVTNKGSNGTAFNLEFINIVYKDDLSSIDAIKIKKNRDLGYKVTEWSGIVYMVGDLGRVIKTTDNGTTWKVLNTNNFNDFKGISFFNEKEGLIVGLNNTILATFSGGDSFVSIQIPSTVGIRDWYDVNFYDTNKAIVVGSLGTILHLSKSNFDWKVDKILNNIPLSKLQVSIKSTDLDDTIKLLINKGTDADLYRQTIRKICSLGNDEFLLVGDNNLLTHLKLSPQIGYILPYLNFLQSNESSDWVDIEAYDDIVKNEKRAFIVKDSNVYSFEWNRFNQNDDINIENITIDLFEENTETIKTIALGDNSLIYGGRRVTSAKKRLFDNNDDRFELIEYIQNPTFNINGIHWSQSGSNKSWIFNNNATVDIALPTNNKSKLLYTKVDLELNKSYTFDFDFNIPIGTSNLEIVFADSLSNLLSGNYLYDNSYTLSISPYTMNNTAGIAYIGFIAHTLSNTSQVFTINSISIEYNKFIHNDDISYSNYLEKVDLSNIFKPRMLFLDYYMGRKINIHLEDGNFVKPKGQIDKSKLKCFYFRKDEYIEFTDYGTIDSQNNYLAYQDHYMLNRRILDQPNSWGKTQSPYNKYNKRITTIDNYTTHAIWEGELSTQGTNSNGNGYNFSNESVTDLTFYNIGDLREDSHASKLRLAWNNTTDTYSTTGLVTQSIIIFSNTIIDYNVNRYIFRISNLLGLNKGDLVKLDFSDKLYYVRREYVSSGNKYLEVDGETIPTPNYTGKITKVNLNFIQTVNKGDVINIICLDKDRNLELNLGEKIYLEIKADDLSISNTAIVKEKDANLYYLEFTFIEFDTTFEVEFSKGSTADEVLLDLRKDTSAPVQIANAILEKRCKVSEQSNFKIIELDVFNFLSTYKNITDIIVNSDNNKMYLSTLDKKVFVIDINDNRVDSTISLSTTSKAITYNPSYKYLYVTGGDLSNPTIDIINTITNTKISTINVGGSSNKALYNPYNKYMYIPIVGNKCLLYNGLTQIGIINVDFTDLIFVDTNNYVYTLSTDNFVRIYDGLTLINTINVGNNLLKLVYNKKDNLIYITASTGIYILNITTNLVDFITVPKGITTKSGIEFVDIVSGNNTKKALFVTNTNLADTNFYITLIDRDTQQIVKEIYTDISVKDIKYNPKENLIYLGGKTGQIVIINPLFDLNNIDVNLDIELYNIESGQISSLFYNELNNRIYPLKNQTFEISYLLTDKLEPSNININLNTLTTDITTVVREVTPDNKMTLWDLFTDEMVYEMNSVDKKLIVKNLNYFDGDLLTLKTNFDKHLLGNSYNLTINKEDFIFVEGSVNDLTKYYNLETFIKYATFGTNTSLTIDTVPVKYDADIVYGANYSILSFLKNLNPIVFTDNYTFDLPSHTYAYQPLFRTALGDFVEFSITKNKIYVGNDLLNITDFREGIFIDITNNSKIVSRVYIKSIQETTYENYPDKKRWIITTDKALDTNLDLTGNVTLRGRNKLIEISRDLEFTDDLMFPISNGGSNAVTLSNNTYYNNQVTSFEYAKILLNDDNIRKYVSSVVHLDEESDWNISVINWKDDPNFFYRPLELFEVGVDRVFKKAITIDSSNYLIKGNTLELMNVDLNKYNYRIVDGMTLKELEEKYYWVLNADIRNAIIGEDTSGFVWYQGDWIAGTWEAGTWYSGKAYDMEWIRGNVYSNLPVNNFNLISTIDNDDATNTIWYKAVWGIGNWFNGTWNDGTWNNGQFNGIWNGGTWTKGIWNGGEFNGGSWLSGTWLSGNFSQNNSFSTWYSGTWLGGDFENGTWKNGIFDQTNRLPSRFGTKATLLNSAVWEYGWWKNGEFHSGLNIDSVSGNTLPSLNYKYSKWFNGTWEKGTFYGGQWEMGIWKNGIWENGYLKSNLEIKEWRVRTSDVVSGKMVEVEFTTPHYYKDLTIGIDDLGETLKLQNYFILLGEPEITEGQIHPNTELLGYNTSAGKHEIVEILDNKTILINIPDENYPYEIIEGTSGYLLNINTDFEAGTNYLISNTQYSNKFGTDKEKIIYANKNISLLRPYQTNIVDNYTWGTKTPSTTLLALLRPADIFWHRKSNKTFITRGYDNAAFINQTRFAVLNNKNMLINTSPVLSGVNFISYDNVNDSIILTSRCLIDSSSSGNANNIYYVNPYDYTTFNLTITSLNSDIVNNAVMNKPYVEDGTSFYSIKYTDLITSSSKSSLIRIDNKTKTVSSVFVNNNITTELEGWDRNRNKIILKESTSGETYLYEMDTLFSNKKFISSSTSGHFFSKYLENKNELFIINDNVLYTWNGKLNSVVTFNSNINSIIWSKNFNAYFIACDEGVKVLSSNKKDILYTYNITNAFEFTQNESIGDKIYVVTKTNTSSKLYLIMNDICKNGCTDYSVFKPVISDSITFDIEKFQYKGEPHIASHWINGKFKRGIWEYGYWVNGLWQGGIWLDGVYENGVYGTV